jgi:hypothetical protein
LRKFAYAVILTILSSPVGAQIISTSIPTGTQPGAGKSATFHLMGGYTYWNINALKSEIQGLKGQNGFMVAGDLAFRAGESATIGVGGWFNGISTVDYNYAITVPGTAQVATINGSIKPSAFSAYGNVFIKSVGVQVGLVRNKGEFSQTVAASNIPGLPAGTATSDSGTSNDITAFGVYRIGSASGERRLGFSAGAGIYRSAADDENEVEASTVFSGFVNGSLGLYKGLTVDAAYWYIAASKGADDSANRLTVGLGYTF